LRHVASRASAGCCCCCRRHHCFNVLSGSKLNISVVKGKKTMKKTYQQLETCRVSSPCCWHPAAAAVAVTVDAAAAATAAVVVVVVIKVVVEVVEVVIRAKTKNK
jgi:hypothetical protein